MLPTTGNTSHRRQQNQTTDPFRPSPDSVDKNTGGHASSSTHPAPHHCPHVTDPSYPLPKLPAQHQGATSDISDHTATAIDSTTTTKLAPPKPQQQRQSYHPTCADDKNTLFKRIHVSADIPSDTTREATPNAKFALDSVAGSAYVTVVDYGVLGTHN